MSQVSAFGGRITIDKPDFYFSPTESYGVLGWVETAIMIVAGIIGVIALFWKTPESNKLKEVLVKSRLGCGTYPPSQNVVSLRSTPFFPALTPLTLFLS